MEDLISIIVPIYNIADYLSECIESILQQTYKNVEIILVDDGSTDGASKICDEFKEKDKRVLVIHKKNGGVSSARNTGLFVAKGKYIGFVDGDDIIHERMYELLYQAIIENEADFSCAIIKRLYGSQKDNEVDPYNIIVEHDNIIKSHLNNKSVPFIGKSLCDKLFHKELLSNILLNEGLTQGEDNLFVTQVLLKCKKCVFVPRELYYYRDIRKGNSSSQYIIDKIFTDKIPVRKEIIELLELENHTKLAEEERRKLYQEYLEYYKEILLKTTVGKQRTIQLDRINKVITEDRIDIKRIVKKYKKELRFYLKWNIYFYLRPFYKLISYRKSKKNEKDK